MWIYSLVSPRRLTPSCLRWPLFSAGCFLLLMLLTAWPLTAQRGAITLPRNLAELVDESAVVVRGHVLSARVEPYPQLNGATTVVVTLRVEEAFKGHPGQTFTFQQFIWDLRDRQDGAGYRKGQDLLLLLIPANKYGLSSPAGLEQGRFRIMSDATGKLIALNGHGNAGLFRDLAPQLKARGLKLSAPMGAQIAEPNPGPLVLGDFRELLRQLIQAE